MDFWFFFAVQAVLHLSEKKSIRYTYQDDSEKNIAGILNMNGGSVKY